MELLLMFQSCSGRGSAVVVPANSSIFGHTSQKKTEPYTPCKQNLKEPSMIVWEPHCRRMPLEKV
jgi:hypothetical protein